MATADVRKRYGKYSAGPFLKESLVVRVTTSEDTIDLLMQNPQFVLVQPVNVDLGGTADPVSATVSGKTVTIHDGTSARDYLIEAMGF